MAEQPHRRIITAKSASRNLSVKAVERLSAYAFRADHADQPLMTLLAAILSLLPETERPALISKALPALRFGMKTAGKALIGWALKQDAVELGEDLEDALKTTGETIVDKTTESLLQDHMKAEQSIRTLQDALAAIAADKPIVLFIDELDRCRPDFALSMLEIIKHIFDIDGVQFVLITNTQQLKAAINHCYGNEVDAQ
ncbi:KAP family P-loop NTPase fold protein [Deefgea piscis]|uniref:KAP family P-loop NTPase fold protein n=1 Tax=Deefgea piscis TaxID=2739061 RepID=UPI001C80A3A9|nr:P-loop NTPase fold protein [Deefgea piscis]QZA80128.1 KAP family NTPase [Deefgea piscis]